MPELAQLSEDATAEPQLRLLVELPSRRSVFFRNLHDLVVSSPEPQLELRSAPAPFWHDVFVKSGLPWLSFLESCAYHVIAAVLLIGLSRFLALQPRPILRPAFEHSQVIYYNASDYLPPMDTRRAEHPAQAKADPEYSPQPIISVPPEADNRSQTIVTAPNIRLKRDVRMPNIVAWSDSMQKPRLEIPAAPLTPAAEINRMAPRMENSIVAPPPDAAHLEHRPEQPDLHPAVVAPPPVVARSGDHGLMGTGILQAPEPAVVAPPPVVENAPVRLGDMNIGRSAVIAPAPQLPMGEQRAAMRGRPGVGAAADIVPPPPSVSGSGSSAAFGSRGRIIALNLRPEVGAPPVAPAGNRRGEFAATPEGHTGASGAPGTSSGSVAGANGAGTNTATARKNDLPAGLYVGTAPASKTAPVAGEGATKSAVSPSTTPSSKPATKGSTVPARAVAPETAAKLSDQERAVFGGRKLYAMNVNMPNLNSAGGSWVIRFAEIGKDPNAAAASDLTQPAAIRTSDPGYPSQLIRENVSGTVIVYGVIHADGTVGDVRVLRGVDDRLDRYACNAVTQWKFQPSTKNGVPVDVEATFQIPFRPPRLQSDF
jgi:TonB family protein